MFNTKNVDARNLRAAILLLPVRSIGAPGVCGVHQLMAPVTALESKVKLASLHYDDMPEATAALDSSSVDRPIILDVTDMLASGNFKGIALRSMKGLCATFGSRAGTPAPAIICTYGFGDPRPPKWFVGPAVPDTSSGHEGDFYVQTGKGILFRRSANAWDSTILLAAPVEKPVIKRPAPKTFPPNR